MRFLTLFLEFFASFPHGTCALLEFHKYLALVGIYQLIRAAIPSNSTLKHSSTKYSIKIINTGVSPCLLSYSKEL